MATGDLASDFRFWWIKANKKHREFDHAVAQMQAITERVEEKELLPQPQIDKALAALDEMERDLRKHASRNLLFLSGYKDRLTGVGKSIRRRRK